MPSVQFSYFSGIRRDEAQIESARLRGSWNHDGYFSEAFHSAEMQPIESEDRCQSLTVIIEFPESETGKVFRWTVDIELAGHSGSGVAEETNKADSRENVRTFTLQAGAQLQQQWYRLNWSRKLGAQKVMLSGESEPRIQFSVWAPNALKVEVVLGDLWEEGDSSSAIDLESIPALRPIPSTLVSGGYITDAGDGVVKSLAPIGMSRDDQGVWSTDINDPNLDRFRRFEHCPYMYRVTRSDGFVSYRTDLYSRCQIGFGTAKPVVTYLGLTKDLDGSVSCSVVKDPDTICRLFSEDQYPEQLWQTSEEFWKTIDGESLPPRPNHIDDLVIYELHIGALGFGKPSNEPGTLQDAINFLDHLQDLGVNAVELLPLAEFGGGGAAWGYSTSHYFAIEYAGGGRDKYKHFIRECHRRGIAVIMDVVFNHYSHDAARAEWMYDTTANEHNCYYWYEGLPGDYTSFDLSVAPNRQGQGGYVDNMSTGWAPRYWEPMVRRMFTSSLLALVLEFHIDGFRFDQTTSIHAYNVLHADGRPVEQANIFGQKLLREATRSLQLIKPNVMLMAEDHSSWSSVSEPLGQGGLGFDATWYSDFYHHLIGDTDKGSDYAKLLKTAGIGDDRPLAFDVFSGCLAATGQARVIYHESHDEAGNGRLTDRTINVAVNNAPLIDDTRRLAEARMRVVTGITLLSAGIPMFLFGEEVGAMKRFLYGEVLNNREDLIGMKQSYGNSLFRFYQAVIKLRLNRDRPALRSRNIEIVEASNSHRVLVFRRWLDEQNFLIVASLNNLAFNRPSYIINSSRLGPERWKEIFNSDSTEYGGNGIGNLGGIIPSGAGWLECVIPANGLVVLERV